MGKTIQVTKQFAENFALVSAYYACSAEEIIEMKRAARADLDNAEISFGLMADEIKLGVMV